MQISLELERMGNKKMQDLIIIEEAKKACRDILVYLHKVDSVCNESNFFETQIKKEIERLNDLGISNEYKWELLMKWLDGNIKIILLKTPRYRSTPSTTGEFRDREYSTPATCDSTPGRAE